MGCGRGLFPPDIVVLYVQSSYPNRCECVRSFQYSITTLQADNVTLLQDHPHASAGW